MPSSGCVPLSDIPGPGGIRPAAHRRHRDRSIPIMSHVQTPRKRLLTKAAIGLSAIGLTGAAALSVGLMSAGATPTKPTAPAMHDSSSFKLVPSPHIHACLPHAGGNVTITRTGINDTMTVSVHGMPPGTGFDLFVI